MPFPMPLLFFIEKAMYYIRLARQVYGLPTAENALIFFKEGTPAYITKRFDVKEDGSKYQQLLQLQLESSFLWTI
mgnify:CR=1 FL=1